MARALTALTIGPLDPSGRDGVLADARTFAALGLHCAAAITAVAGRTSTPEEVVQQLETVLTNIQVDAVKLTCPADASVLAAIASAFSRLEVSGYVLDPEGAALDAGAASVLKAQLLPAARVAVPNILEAQALSGRIIDTWEDMREAAQAIADLGPSAVVIKGGKLRGDLVTDLLFDGSDYRDFTAERVEGNELPGAGTTFAAALAATLAKGETVQHSAAAAKAYVTKALQSRYELGDVTALHHFYRYWQPSAPASLAPDEP
jgi:hydroxymethylpyrimidine/phosphomethylpyrimidine kinase